MPKLLEKWEVMPHGELETVDDGLLSVAGTIRMPLGQFPRRMSVVQLLDGRTAIFSAIALDEAAMGQIEALGPPAWLIVPNGHHRLDAGAWKARYPDIHVLAPAGAQDDVEEAVETDAVTDPFGDPAVRFLTVPGTGKQESALEVRRASGLTLIVNDVIAHVAHPEGLGARIMARLMGFGVREPQVPRVVRHMLVEDRTALAGQFRRWAAVPDLKRIIVSHGDIIEDRPAEVLETLAEALD